MTEIHFNPSPLPPPDRSGPRRGADQPTIPADPCESAMLSGSRGEAVRETESRVPPEDHVFELTDATFDDFLKKQTTPVFIEFFNPT